MSKAGFDFTEIFVLEQSFHNIGKQFPRETGEFLRKQGTELNRQTKKLAKQRVGRNGKCILVEIGINCIYAIS